MGNQRRKPRADGQECPSYRGVSVLGSSGLILEGGPDCLKPGASAPETLGGRSVEWNARSSSTFGLMFLMLRTQLEVGWPPSAVPYFVTLEDGRPRAAILRHCAHSLKQAVPPRDSSPFSFLFVWKGKELAMCREKEKRR